MGYKVLILSDSDSAHGAAIAASRLCLGLQLAGNEVHAIYAKSEKKKHTWTSYPLFSQLSPKGALFETLTDYFFSSEVRAKITKYRSTIRVRKLVETIKPDIINVHTIFFPGWDVNLLSSLPSDIPIVWTLHDMWSFTGNCSYTGGSCKFKTGCDAECDVMNKCMGVHRHLMKSSQISAAWQSKADFVKNRSNLAAVTPSRWLKDRASEGIWKCRPVHHIPNGLELDSFTPISKQAARACLSIASQGPVLLLTATNLADKRKGACYALKALQQFTDRSITLLTVGSEPPKLDLPGVDVRHMGFVNSNLLQTMIYSAADILLHPAEEDNLPNTVLESLACGTPVAAFAIGGLPDMVIENETGWIEHDVSVEGYSACLNRALNDLNSGIDLKNACRAKAENEYPLSLQAQRYMDLFTLLTSPSRTH